MTTATEPKYLFTQAEANALLEHIAEQIYYQLDECQVFGVYSPETEQSLRDVRVYDSQRISDLLPSLFEPYEEEWKKLLWKPCRDFILSVAGSE